MNEQQHSEEAGTSIRDFFKVLQRHRWLSLFSLLVVPAVAVILSARQDPVYESEASVVLTRDNLANVVTDTPDTTSSLEFARVVQTQAQLAHSNEVAERVISLLGLDRDATALLARVVVEPADDADILLFAASEGSKRSAQELASTFAREYVSYRQELDSVALDQASDDLKVQIDKTLRADRDTEFYATLVSRYQQLRTLQALQSSNSFVVRPATTAGQIAPNTVRSGIIGLVLGAVIGVGLALLFEALDTRIRSGEEIADSLGLRLLGRLPPPPRKLRERNELVMLADPGGGEAEAIRMLRVNLDLLAIDHPTKVMMVTSGLAAEGKSTTASNLAIAHARAGRDVVLVDLDLRKPWLGTIFNITGAAGITGVALGQASLDDALLDVPLDSGVAPLPAIDPTNGHTENVDLSAHAVAARGRLRVLPVGMAPPHPGEFAGGRAVASVIADLREKVDLVIVDSPPILRVGDAMTTTAHVDTVLFVARRDALRRPMLKEIARLLSSFPVPILGIALTGADQVGNAYGADYGYGYGYGATPNGSPAESVSAQQSV